MGQFTNIEWCDSTINGSSGCDGCELWNEGKRTCYAGITHEIRWAKGLAISHPHLYSPSFRDVLMIPGRFARAAAWSDLTGTERPDKPWLNGRPRHIFVGDMGDFLSRGVTDEFLERELLGAITSENGRRHVWMLLTKRPARLAELSHKWGGLPPNVIAMTTLTSQVTAAVRMEQLASVACHRRMFSIEPMLGPVDLVAAFGKVMSSALERQVIHPAPCPLTYGEVLAAVGRVFHGAIVGGESGRDLANPATGPQPMHPDWARTIRDQCAAAGMAFFFKQWGAWLPDNERPFRTSGAITWGLLHTSGAFRSVLTNGVRNWAHDPAWGDGEEGTTKVGVSRAGRLLNGREWNDLPEVKS